MGAFARIEREVRRPPATIVVPVEAFAPSWEDRPREPVACGIRPLSESDILFCRGEAVRIALAAHPLEQGEAALDERVAAHNDALMRLAVSRGTCDPNDATQVWSVWGIAGGDDVVRDALTPDGVRMLWDALERTTLATSPVIRPATDEEIGELAAKAPRALAAMSHAQAMRCRRMLRACLDDILSALGEPPVD